MPERLARLANQLASDKDWEAVTATVIESTYHYARLRDLSDEGTDNSFYQIHVHYDVQGERFYDDFEQFEPLDPGHRIKILYNPADPRQNSLSPRKPGPLRLTMQWIIGIVITLFIAWLLHHFDLPDDYTHP